jgi:F-type H+-transporting ATPase subunit a
VLLAQTNLLEYLSDHPWPGWRVEVLGVPVTLMSSAIFTMVLVTAVLWAVLVPLARRWRTVPHGGPNALEVIVVFVRDMIARPALHERAYHFLPFLLTLFVFILALNLVGLVPLEYVGKLAGVRIGGTPTAVLSVCGGLAGVTLLMIVFSGLRRTARRWSSQRNWPAWLCGVLSPVLWLVSLSPSIPGTAGAVLRVPLSLLEFVGAIGKCFALVIRLFANMLSGHVLFSVMMLFVFEAAVAWARTGSMHIGHIGPTVVIASVLVSFLEILVGCLQAYIFTFLAAMFLGLYAEAEH